MTRRLLVPLLATLLGLPAFAQEGGDDAPVVPAVRPEIRPGPPLARPPVRLLPAGVQPGCDDAPATPEAPATPASSTGGDPPRGANATGGTSPTGARTLGNPNRQKPPRLAGTRTRVQVDGTFTLEELVNFFADLTGRNFILADKKNLRDEVTIISHHEVTVEEAYEAFLQSLALTGYTTVTTGQNTTLVKTESASQAPIGVGTDGEIYDTSLYVTQIIPLANVSVSDVNSVVSSMVGPGAKVIAYAPSNTLIITDSSHNLAKVYSIIQELDIAAPRSSLEIIPIRFADATAIQQIVTELYGGESSSSTPQARPQTAAERRRARRRPRRDEPEAQNSADSVTAGKESKYISKVLADERTNSLIVLANEQGMAAVRGLVGTLDVDVDLTSRAQIHVVYLEHAKADEVAQVLSNLSEGGASATRRPSARSPARTTATSRAATARSSRQAEHEGGGGEESGGAIAAFDSGMRITSDENTNSLVIIASPEDFRIVKTVIDKLDVRRRQVFVDAVIFELSSDESLEIGTAIHGPFTPADGTTGIIGGQFGASSFGLTQDLLSGLAVGVFGENMDVTIDGTTLSVPTFGVVLNFLKTNSGVNIVSNPNLLTLDNEEAKITVGRKVPFPTQSGLNNLGQPVVSYQREDVAITLQITPRVNSTDYVTLEVELEASEIEEDDQGLDVNQSGFITSKREVETTALVRDNQTVVIGGLLGTTETQVETKVPILGDLPLVGALFRGSRNSARKSNLMIFLTPHIIDDEEDMLEVQRVKEAQRQEYIRRFYGQSRERQIEELQALLSYSMNNVDQPSMFRGATSLPEGTEVGGEPLSDEARAVVQEVLDEHRGDDPGAGAGELTTDHTLKVDLDVLPEDTSDEPLAVPEEQ